MSDVNVNLAIRVLVADVNQWTPVVAPISCGQIMLLNTDSVNAQRVRTDPNDPATEKPIAASAEITFRASAASAWGPNMTVCFVRPVAGSGPIVATYIR